VAYVADIYVGSQDVAETMIFDTGSGWVTVPLSNCSDCSNDNYDPANSTTAEWISSSMTSLSVIISLFINISLFSMDQLI
jgi:Eukaryotic aspartyl protease